MGSASGGQFADGQSRSGRKFSNLYILYGRYLTRQDLT